MAPKLNLLGGKEGFPASRPSERSSGEASKEQREKAEKWNKELISTHHLPGLYTALGALAVPVLVLLLGGWRKPS